MVTSQKCEPWILLVALVLMQGGMFIPGFLQTLSQLFLLSDASLRSIDAVAGRMVGTKEG
jgi:hypothetical protein